MFSAMWKQTGQFVQFNTHNLEAAFIHTHQPLHWAPVEVLLVSGCQGWDGDLMKGLPLTCNIPGHIYVN